MTDRQRDMATVLLAAAMVFGLFIWCLVKPADAISESERRPLASAPELSAKSFINGSFMESFEKYAADQFPQRDMFRSVKAFTAINILGNRDVNKVYRNAEGYLSKLEYPMDESSLKNAADKLGKVYDSYLNNDGVRVYFSIVPDKNYFMAADSGALGMDYEKLVSYMRERTESMEYIDIFDCLSLEDYYKTDTHWRQEKVVPAAQRLADAMGLSIPESYETKTLEGDFYGVYAGQWAMKIPPEKLNYLTGELLDKCGVYDYETKSEIPIYDMEKGKGRDGYELFLSGSKSMLRIDNPEAENDRKLIIFRDSFGSSMAPLLAQGARETYVIDIRYISPEILSRFVEFENCDVLFIYSALVLNNSVTLK